MVKKARMNFARWWYHADIPFHAAHSVYYQEALDSIATIGLGFKGPSYHDLKGPLLQKHVGEMNDYLLDVKNDWKVYECSIMSDGWTNKKNPLIINFLVYCPRGTMFLKSLGVSGLTRDAYTLFKLFDKIVQEVGVEHIVQFITDNDSAYKSARKKLMQKYWSPCATHCIDLMLEKISDVAITRFATEFLSLQCLTKFKKELRQMFTCDQWVESRYARDVMGKEVATIVLEDNEFWLQCQQIVKVSEPLVRVLRLADGDEKPLMGYLYEAMDKAKENIKVRSKNKISAYIPFTSVIDARWDKQLYSPLHVAAEESKFLLLTKEDVNWASIEKPLATMILEDDDIDDDVVVLDKDNGDNDVVLTNANTHVYYGPDVDPFER
ncbi:uncharacterized protein LOC142616613 [Castanea sativa]|uniref:uncharacterized protein LOC142616613 n=1 Tax=Castanea sativa TaxID=21020 RepID=UPI003F653BEC